MTILDAMLQGIRFGLTGFGAAFAFVCCALLAAPIVVLLMGIVGAVLCFTNGGKTHDTDDVH